MSDIRRAVADLQKVMDVQAREIGVLQDQVGWIRKGTLLHIDGSTALEKLWRKEIEAPDGEGYEAVKRRAGAVLAKEVAQFLGYSYPGFLQASAAPSGPGTVAYNRYDLVREFCVNIVKPKLVINVNAKWVRGAPAANTREVGRFSVQLDFGTRHLYLRESLGDGLSALLMEKSGMAVWKDQDFEELLAIQTVPRPAAGGAGEEAGPAASPAAAAASGVVAVGAVGGGGPAGVASAADGGAVGPAPDSVEEAEPIEGVDAIIREAEEAAAGGGEEEVEQEISPPGSPQSVIGDIEGIDGTRLLVYMPAVITRKTRRQTGQKRPRSEVRELRASNRPPPGAEAKASPPAPPAGGDGGKAKGKAAKGQGKDKGKPGKDTAPKGKSKGKEAKGKGAKGKNTKSGGKASKGAAKGKGGKIGAAGRRPAVSGR